MRYPLFILFVMLSLAFPMRGMAAENFGSESETVTAAKVSTAFATLSSHTENSAITTSPADAKESAFQESGVRQGVGVAAVQDTTLLRIMKRKSSFQNYVESSTGKTLDVFGRELFRNVPSTFAPLKAAQVNMDYVIGPGDALQIRGWGMVDIDVNVTVNRSGEIYIPRVGSVKVSGVKYRDLQGYLKKAVGRIFTNFDLSASIAQTRSVQIYVVGHALRPGSYTLSAMSTILNALFASGGPSVTGSMRDIQLKRGQAPPVSFDLYDMLLFGDKSTDRSLQDGDVIYIPEIGPLVALLGDVKRPAIFELKTKTSLSEIVNWAGGFESVAGPANVIVEKSVDSRYQTVAELQADKGAIEKALSKLIVHPTDIIRVFAPGAAPLEVKVEREFVRVDGEVKQNGVFELQKAETLRSLIARIGGISDKGYVYGTKLTRESVRREQQLKISEAVDRYEKDMETSAKQRLAGENGAAQAAVITSELESQRRLAQKLRSVRAEGRIILTLKDFRAQISDLPDIPLKDGDRVYIPEKPATVDVLGAVYQQNTFIYQQSQSMSDYLTLAGGVSATGDKGEIYRICADGSVKSKRHSGMGGSVNPGDAIVVPERLKEGVGFMTTLKDLTTILYQFGLGAAGLATLKTL